MVEDVGIDDGCLEGFSVNVSALCACCGSAGTGSGTGAAGTGSNGAANVTRVEDGTAVGFVDIEGSIDGCVDGA